MIFITGDTHADVDTKINDKKICLYNEIVELR